MKKIIIFLFGICLAPQLVAQEQQYFMNPVIRGDMPDPSMIRIDDTYYATGTSSEWAPFYPVFTSKDMVNWKQAGHIFSKQPSWTSNSFWAPELFYHNSKVYCYYTARQKSTGISYIGVATSDSPLHEFTDHGPIITYGTEAIDAFIYDDNGQLYISWKAYGLDKRPIELLGCKLSADGLHLKGEPFSLLVDDEEIGMEGQYHFKQGDYYYIIYSAHGCCGPSSNYDVYVARSKNFCGPYEKYTGNPVLHGGEGDYLSCGHGTVVKTPDGKMFYMCHAYLKGEGFYAVNPFCTSVNPAADTHLNQSGDVDNSTRKSSLSGLLAGTSEKSGLESAGKKISLKIMTLNNSRQKINDCLGNPVEIGIAVMWRVVDTSKAVFNVDNYKEYLSLQCDTALRNIVRVYPYDVSPNVDTTGDGVADEGSLRGSSEVVAARIRDEIQKRVSEAGLEILEARITYLAYAPEIAAVMLQRQQASAIIDARKMIVDGAVGMVEMALDRLSEKKVVELDEERKAAMVSNLLVVLCGNKDAQPIVNSGSLY